MSRRFTNMFGGLVYRKQVGDVEEVSVDEESEVQNNQVFDGIIPLDETVKEYRHKQHSSRHTWERASFAKNIEGILLPQQSYKV
jgi:hypothetical protein